MSTTAQLILLLASIATAWAQANFPSCAQPCLTTIGAAVGCPALDVLCLCTNPDFRNKTAECSLLDCNKVVIYLQVITALDDMCKDVDASSTSTSSTQSSSTSQSSTTTSSTSTTTSSSSSSSPSSTPTSTPTPTLTQSPTPPPQPRFSSTSTTVIIEVVTVVSTTTTSTSSGIQMSPSIGSRWILSCFVGSWITSVILVLV